MTYRHSLPSRYTSNYTRRPKAQKPRRTVFRNRPRWAGRCYTPDEDETIEQPSSGAGAVKSVERTDSLDVAEIVDDENLPGGKNIRGRSIARSDYPVYPLLSHPYLLATTLTGWEFIFFFSFGLIHSILSVERGFTLHSRKRAVVEG